MTYAEAMQRDADEYFEQHPLATTKELAIWAVQTGRWEPPSDLVLKRCRQDFARALRAQHILDETGHVVRAKHAARMKGPEQLTFWGDIRTAPTEHIEISFQQRRVQIVGECAQLSRDIDYYNRTRTPGRPYQKAFDFRDDVEEENYSPS
jgi:hypothetical protein